MGYAAKLATGSSTTYNIKYLGSGSTSGVSYDLTTIPGYDKLTSDNFYYRTVDCTGTKKTGTSNWTIDYYLPYFESPYMSLATSKQTITCISGRIRAAAHRSDGTFYSSWTEVSTSFYCLYV